MRGRIKIIAHALHSYSRMSRIENEPLFNLLYYCYAPLGKIGRERIALALTATPEGESSSFLQDAAGRSTGRSASPPLPISGRCRVGLDGLNSSLTGQLAALKAHARFVSSFVEIASLPPIDFKYAPVYASRKETDASFPLQLFNGFTVMRVAEIVTLNAPNIDIALTGRHASPVEFHKLLVAPLTNTILIDVRNSYESDIGAFTPPTPENNTTTTTAAADNNKNNNSTVTLLRPPVRRFDEMPKWVEDNSEMLSTVPTIAMYCTGGVRCERFSALVRQRFPTADVVQLDGGVQRYMEKAEENPQSMIGGSIWKGKLFVFDDRPAVSIASSLAGGDASSANSKNPHLQGILSTCVRCQKPWDTYKWIRCDSCGVLILMCDTCVLAATTGVVTTSDVKTQCHSCAGGNAPKKREPGIPRRCRTPRLPRPDLVEAAAARRREQEVGGNGGGDGNDADVDLTVGGSLEGWLRDDDNEYL